MTELKAEMIVNVRNAKLDGIPIIEGKAKLIRKVNDIGFAHERWMVEFVEEEGSIYPRNIRVGDVVK